MNCDLSHIYLLFKYFNISFYVILCYYKMKAIYCHIIISILCTKLLYIESLKSELSTIGNSYKNIFQYI